MTQRHNKFDHDELQNCSGSKSDEDFHESQEDHTGFYNVVASALQNSSKNKNKSNPGIQGFTTDHLRLANFWDGTPIPSNLLIPLNNPVFPNSFLDILPPDITARIFWDVISTSCTEDVPVNLLTISKVRHFIVKAKENLFQKGKDCPTNVSHVLSECITNISLFISEYYSGPGNAFYESEGIDENGYCFSTARKNFNSWLVPIYSGVETLAYDPAYFTKDKKGTGQKMYDIIYNAAVACTPDYIPMPKKKKDRPLPTLWSSVRSRHEHRCHFSPHYREDTELDDETYYKIKDVADMTRVFGPIIKICQKKDDYFYTKEHPLGDYAQIFTNSAGPTPSSLTSGSEIEKHFWIRAILKQVSNLSLISSQFRKFLFGDDFRILWDTTFAIIYNIKAYLPFDPLNMFHFDDACVVLYDFLTPLLASISLSLPTSKIEKGYIHRRCTLDSDDEYKKDDPLINFGYTGQLKAFDAVKKSIVEDTRRINSARIGYVLDTNAKIQATMRFFYMPTITNTLITCIPEMNLNLFEMAMKPHPSIRHIIHAVDGLDFSQLNKSSFLFLDSPNRLMYGKKQVKYPTFYDFRIQVGTNTCSAEIKLYELVCESTRTNLRTKCPLINVAWMLSDQHLDHQPCDNKPNKDTTPNTLATSITKNCQYVLAVTRAFTSKKDLTCGTLPSDYYHMDRFVKDDIVQPLHHRLEKLYQLVQHNRAQHQAFQVIQEGFVSKTRIISEGIALLHPDINVHSHGRQVVEYERSMSNHPLRQNDHWGSVIEGRITSIDKILDGIRTLHTSLCEAFTLKGVILLEDLEAELVDVYKTTKIQKEKTEQTPDKNQERKRKYDYIYDRICVEDGPSKKRRIGSDTPPPKKEMEVVNTL
jgi:hypothetical protein